MRRMAPIVIALLVGTAGCRDEPTFDERYDAAQNKITTSAKRIDRDLEGTSGAAGSSVPDDGGTEKD